MTVLAVATQWLFTTGAIALAIPALILLTRALFADRSKGVPRCPKCWYDLSATRPIAEPTKAPECRGTGSSEQQSSGNPNRPSEPVPRHQQRQSQTQTKVTSPTLPTTCPECARTIQKLKHLHRTRRHKRSALAALTLLTLAATTAAWPNLRLIATPKSLSTLQLATLAPLAMSEPPPTQHHRLRKWRHDIYQALTNRFDASFLSDRSKREWNHLIRMAHYSSDRRVITLALRNTSDPIVFSKLFGNPTKPFIYTRAKWLRNTPLHANLNYKGRAEGYHSRQFELTLDIPGSTTYARYITKNTSTAPTPSNLIPLCTTVELGMLPPHSTSIPIRCRILDTDHDTVLWSGRQDIPIELVDSADLALSPVRDHLIDLAIHESIFLDTGWPAMHLPINVRTGSTYRHRETHPLLEDITIALRIDFLHQGEVCESGSAWTHSNISYGASERLLQSITVENMRLVAPLEFDPTDSDWTVRISPDPELALRCITCDRYWAGDPFEQPLFELFLPKQPWHDDHLTQIFVTRSTVGIKSTSP